MANDNRTSAYYAQNAEHLAQLYDRAGEGILSLVEKFAKHKGMRILDYGCGTGRDAARLLAKGYTNVTGYDPSAAMLAAGLKRYPQLTQKVSSKISVIENAAPYDLIYSSAVLQHIHPTEIKDFIKNIFILFRADVRPAELKSHFYLVLSYPIQWPGSENEERLVCLHDPGLVFDILTSADLTLVEANESGDSLERPGRIWRSEVWGI